MSTTLSARPTTSRGLRSRRIALIDRPWVGYRSLLIATPVHAPSFDALRALVATYIREHPELPLAGRMNEEAGRWIPVPAGDVEAHLDRIVIAAPAPGPDGIDEHISAYLPAAAADLPFVVVASPSSILVIMSHAVGDAGTLSRLILALARVDPDRLAAIEPRVGSSVPFLLLVRRLRTHYRGWLAHLRGQGAEPSFEPAPGPASARPVGLVGAAPRPAFAGRVLTSVQLRELTRWRNANAPGVALTSVLTSAIHRSLTDEGIPVHGDGYFALFDVRSYLPRSADPPYGNLAKSLHLRADLRDPRSVAAAMADAVRSGRAIPAIAIATVAGALRRPATPAPAAPGPMTLTVNTVPSLPGMNDLPWRDGAMKRFYGIGTSTGPESITVFLLHMRDHMEITVSFDEGAATMPAVRRALAALADPSTLLGTTPEPVRLER